MNIYKILISMMIVLCTSTLLMADLVILKDWTVIRGTTQAGNEKVLNITEEQSKKTITIRRDNIKYIVEENLLDEDILKNYKTFNWKNFDFDKLEEKKQEKQREKIEVESSFSALYRPRVGFLAGTSIPFGDIGAALSPGVSVMLFNDYKIPIKKIDFRGGLTAGYISYTSKVENFPADVSLIPFVAYGDISLRTEIGLIPYFRLGAGVTMASLTDNSSNAVKQDASSTDLTVLIGVGTGYINENLPYVEFCLDVSYLRFFEKVSGNFINASLGASYHFYTERL